MKSKVINFIKSFGSKGNKETPKGVLRLDDEIRTSYGNVGGPGDKFISLKAYIDGAVRDVLENAKDTLVDNPVVIPYEQTYFPDIFKEDWTSEEEQFCPPGLEKSEEVEEYIKQKQEEVDKKVLEWKARYKEIVSECWPKDENLQFSEAKALFEKNVAELKKSQLVN